MKFRIFLLGFLISMPWLQAQQVLPFVENFTKSDYWGENQVWNATQGQEDALYFANNHYILRYNGVRWERFQLPNKTIIRSVFSDGQRVYSGSYNEFGYWKREKGQLRYFSLSEHKNLFEGNSVNEEIWKIFKFKNTIYFQSFNQLYAYNGTTVRKINLPGLISYCFPIDNKVYVATATQGVFVFDGEKFTVQSQWKILENKIIHAIEKHDGSLYFFTRNDGIFIGNAQGITSFNHPLNNRFKTELINTARFIDSHRLAIGTAFKGLYILNSKEGTYQNINRNNALKNNSILSICLDREHDLWLGMDNGIAHVEINSPYLLFNDNSGELGTVYAIAPLGKGYLLGSNHGLFRYENDRLELVKGSQGQVWHILPVNGKYIIGHNDGTFAYENGQLQKISPINGGWKVIKSPFGQGYYQANYSGIAHYDEQFQWIGRLDKIQKPIRNLMQVSASEIYAVDNYKSVYKLQLDSNGKVKEVVNITHVNHIKKDFNVKMFAFRGLPLFYINNQWFTVNSISGKLEPNAVFNTHFKEVTTCVPIDEDHFLVSKNGLLFIITYAQNQFYWSVIPKKYYEGKSPNEDTQVVKQGDRLIVNLDDGFFSFKYTNPRKRVQNVRVEGYINSHLMEQGEEVRFNQPVTLNVISSYYGFLREDLFYALNGARNFNTATQGLIQLNNLDYGHQRVSIYIREGAGFKKIGEYQFTVAKPWYISFWMVMVYLLLIFGGLFLYYRWNKVRYLEKLRLKDEEMRHQQAIYQLELETNNKMKIQEYEKNILEIQVQKKASEVAGKSLSIAKQSEMIDSILKLLEKENDINSLKSNVRKVIKMNSINKKEWETFETNLFKSHEDFIKRLTARFDKLTSKDIKLCIYLKMSLSSKEIAPLMNISFRGVELHRYRLRKKMGLDQEISLSSFINSI